VTTNAATGITTTGATLNGTVSSNGASTTVTFQYGLTASYGSTVTAAQSPLGAGATNAAVSAALSGLTCNTLYHFRAVGANSAGPTNGADATFTAAACPPITTTTTNIVRTDDPDRPFVLIFTATVTGTAPTRAVGFTDAYTGPSGVNTVCGAQPLGGGGNTARTSCEPGSLSNGMHWITAMYGGDAANAPSMSAPLAYPVTPPGPASIAAVTLGNGDAKVQVAAPTNDGGTPVTGFTVTTTSGEGKDQDAGTLASTHVVTQLTNGVTYTFLVTASNAAGIGVPSPPSDAVVPLGGLPSAYSANYVQKVYVAYYGRPADPVGHAYWSARMDAEGQSLNAIIAAFGNSEEFNRRYGGLTYSALVTLIYQQALGRDPDLGGLAYYVSELEAGRRTLQSITLDVLNGARTAPDAIVVSNRLEVAAYYMERAVAGCGDGTVLGGEQDGVDTLSVVTANAATVTAAKVDIDARCPPALDVTQPGDPIVPTSNNSPGLEGVSNAIDNQPTKYLNLDRLNTGFTVSPRVGSTIVNGLRLTSANDAPERDPADFALAGSHDGVNFTPIASGSVPPFPSRSWTKTILFSNHVPYLHYRLIFPHVVGPGGNSMQILEVELLGMVEIAH